MLGNRYLGVNGLFTDVLGVLSFAELGFGTAINFSLYKPVAQNDIEKTKSLMLLYKRVYRVIAIIIAIFGVALVPFLKYIVKDPGNIGDIRLYFLIFLFNTVSSYFVSYKFSLVNAEQKNYISTNANTITNVVQNIVQIIVLITTSNFLLYLLFGAIVQLAQKIILNKYLDRKYPILKEKDVQPLDQKEMSGIKRNVKALVMHKFGDISIHQTDNIIISSCISISTTGIVSNYNLIFSTIQTFLSGIFNNVVSGLGNLVATSDKEKQLEVFNKYNFINFWLYGFSSICLLTLSQPFITLWIGKENTIDMISLTLIVTNFYFSGQRTAFLNFKTAHGKFYDDKYVVLQSALINLVLSLILASFIDLPGVYIGTLVSGLYQSIIRPMISFKDMTNKSSLYYFKKLIIYFISVSVLAILLVNIYSYLEISWLTIAIILLLNCVIINLVFFIIYRNTDEFKGIISMIGFFRKEIKNHV